MVERDIGAVLLFAAAAVDVVVVRVEMRVLLLCECVVGETVMKLPLMSNTAKKRIIDEEDKEVMIVVVVVVANGFSFPLTAGQQQSAPTQALSLSPFLRPFITPPLAIHAINPSPECPELYSFPVQIVDNERITKSSKKSSFGC
jgi:hypothetical protein